MGKCKKCKKNKDKYSKKILNTLEIIRKRERRLTRPNY